MFLVTDISKWLRLAGLELSRVVPLLDPTSTAALSTQFLCGEDFISFGAECHLRERVRQFHRLQTVEASSVLPRTPFGDSRLLRWSSSASVFGEGITVTNYSGFVLLQFINSPTLTDKFLQDAKLVL